MINPSDVSKLREMTGAGIMDCKKALQDADGDFEKAKVIIGERGVVKAEKKADREATAGLIESYVHNGRVGVLLEINCETDFVARTDQFKDLAKNVAMQISAMNPSDTAELLTQQYIKDPNMTVDGFIKGAIAKLGENIKLGKFIRYEL